MDARISLPPRKVNRVVAGCMILYGCVMCVNMSAPVILPKMLAEIDGLEYYAFTAVVNSIGIMISAPVAGKIGDAIGRKWLTVTALLVHMAVLLLLSLSHSALVFVGLYVVSGFCLGLYISMPHAILGDILDLEQRGKYYGLLSASGACGMLLGPLLSGLVVDTGHPRYAFYVTFLPILLSILLLRNYPNRKTAEGPVRPDFAGLLLLAAMITCCSAYINFGGSKFPRLSGAGIALLAAGVISGVCFFLHIRKVPDPIVDLSLFSSRTFSVAWLLRLAFTAYLLCASSFLLLYAQNVLGVSATVSSTLTMPQTICMIVLSPFIGRLISKNRRYFRVCYLAMGLCSMAALAIWSRIAVSSPLFLLYAGMAIGGVAYAVEQTVSTPYFQLSIRPEQYGAAQGMSFFASSAGGTIWGAIYGAILSAGETASQIGVIFQTGLCIMAAMFLAIVFFVKPPSAQSA